MNQTLAQKLRSRVSDVTSPVPDWESEQLDLMDAAANELDRLQAALDTNALCLTTNYFLILGWTIRWLLHAFRTGRKIRIRLLGHQIRRSKVCQT